MPDSLRGEPVSKFEWRTRMVVSIALGVVATWLDWDVIVFRNWPHVTWQNDLGLFVLLMASAMLPPKRAKKGEGEHGKA